MEDPRANCKVKNEVRRNRSNSAYRKSKSSSVFHRDSKREQLKQELNEDEEGSEHGDYMGSKEFDILILIEKVDYETINEGFMGKVKKQYMLNDVSYDSKLSVPGIEGKVLRISGDSLQDTAEIVSVCSNNCKSDKTNIILIPEGLVSLVIGAKGKRIKSLLQKTCTKIVVSQPIYGLTHRAVTIKGHTRDVGKAIYCIHDIMSEKAHLVDELEYEPPIIDLANLKVTAKLVVVTRIAKELIKEKLKEMCNNNNVMISIKKPADGDQVLSPTQNVILFEGKMNDVEICTEWLIEKCHKLDHKSIQILIPGSLVSKIIGSKGCLIRDISSKSGGAQISILSDKRMERSAVEILVEITGGVEPKQRATNMLLEQVELFKQGGPVLQSGKVLNKNMVMQFENSVFAKNSKIRQIFDECRNYGSHEEDDIKRKSKKRKRDDKYYEKDKNYNVEENDNEDYEGKHQASDEEKNYKNKKHMSDVKRKSHDSSCDKINIKLSPVTGHTMISSCNEESENNILKIKLIKPKSAKAENMPIKVYENDIETKGGESLTIWEIESSYKNIESLIMKLQDFD